MFKEISPYDISKNAFEMIGKDWFLICAGNENASNCMTASWGQMGVLWNKPVFTCVVRPQRYTYEFTEKFKDVAICFFDETYREQLTFCGRNSGRDVNKLDVTGFTPVYEDGAVYYNEANLVLICEKIYVTDIKETEFLDKNICDSAYPNKDFHRAYTLLVKRVLIKK
jgi:flavin reductase (DIM6/NTAB) family NADH-FMN oxidoreductase RutF